MEACEASGRVFLVDAYPPGSLIITEGTYIDHPGANPSLHWNVYLATWVMVYGGWDGKVYITSSLATNLTDWAAPRVLVESDQAGRAWYPTIVGARGDVVAGKNSLLYYSDMAMDFSVRKFYRASLQLER